MKEVAGRTAFITGGGSGMGLGMARAFVAAGMQVAIADVREDHLAEAIAGFGPEDRKRVHPLQVDVADRDAMADAAEQTVARFGKVHVLCNNAGAGLIGPLVDASYDDWDWGISVNLGGVVNGVQSFLPKIREHGEGGHIVSTSSMQGLFVGAVAGIYCATKFAVVGMMEALRPELAPLGIGVSAFCPGLVNTNIHDAEAVRPAKYSDSRYIEPMRARASGFKARVLAAGMDPLEVGQRVLQGIRDDDLYILTHPEYEQGVRDRFEAILASFRNDHEPPADRVAAEQAVLRYPTYIEELERQRARRLARGTDGKA